MIVYLTRDWLVTTGLILGVSWLVALAVGIGVGKAVRIADERTDDATWLADQPTEVLSQDEIDAQFDAIGERTWWA